MNEIVSHKDKVETVSTCRGCGRTFSDRKALSRHWKYCAETQRTQEEREAQRERDAVSDRARRISYLCEAMKAGDFYEIAERIVDLEAQHD